MVRDRRPSKAGEQRWTQVQRGSGDWCGGQSRPAAFGPGSFSLLFLGWSVDPLSPLVTEVGSHGAGLAVTASAKRLASTLLPQELQRNVLAQYSQGGEDVDIKSMNRRCCIGTLYFRNPSIFVIA